MRTITAVVFALLIGCMIPAYSQLNQHKKIERSSDQFLQKTDKEGFFSEYKFPDKFTDPWRTWTPNDLRMQPTESTQIKSNGRTYSHDLMPVLKPEGVFHMRLFQPEGKYFMKVYLLDW